MSSDRYEVCLFEQRGSSYRFAQSCSTKGLTSTFDRCNMDWIVTDFWYDKVQKERSGSR